MKGRENQGKEQEDRRSSNSARTQIITTYSSIHPNTNKYSSNTPNKSNHLSSTKKYPNLAESGGKTIGVKKASKDDGNCMENLHKQLILMLERVRSNLHFSLTNQLFYLCTKRLTLILIS